MKPLASEPMSDFYEPVEYNWSQETFEVDQALKEFNKQVSKEAFMLQFPSSLPTEAIQILVKKLRKKEDVAFSRLNHAAWEVYGYASSQLLPDADTMPALHFSSDEDMVFGLEALIAGDPRAPRMSSIGWKGIMKSLLDMLVKSLLEKAMNP